MVYRSEYSRAFIRCLFLRVFDVRGNNSAYNKSHLYLLSSIETFSTLERASCLRKQNIGPSLIVTVQCKYISFSVSAAIVQFIGFIDAMTTATFTVET